jgi:uncharacterized protein YhjY with autotransporter beta-barrel domain
MLDYGLILSINYPNAQWTLDGDSYNGLIWLDSSLKPTQVELDNLWESTQATVADKKAQAEATKASALAKLAALGLTQDEVKALLG